ncbi:hypothetical protein T4B_10409, partial [Trichinella pseudospiralis]
MNEYETASLTLKHIGFSDAQMMEDLKIFTSICDGMRNSFANVKVKWIFVLKTNNVNIAILFMMFKFSIDHYYKLILNGMSTVVRSDDPEVLLCIICSSRLYGFYIVSDKRLKSTVDCSDNISSLFMVALGAGTTQVFYSGADNRPEVSRYSTDEKYSNIFWFRRTYKQLMQWFLMCLKIHGLYSGVVLWYFGVYYAATLPDQASWTGSRGVLLGNMYL